MQVNWGMGFGSWGHKEITELSNTSITGFLEGGERERKWRRRNIEEIIAESF